MKKIHVAVVAVILALAAVLGTFAATRTAQAGSAGTKTQDAAIAKRTRQLDALEASLKKQLAATPTKARSVLAAAPAPRVVYHRPPPIVVTTHRSHDDEGYENESEHEGSDD